MDMVEDIQELCIKNLIKHFVMFDDLYPSKRQVQVSNSHPRYSIVSIIIYPLTCVAVDDGEQNLY